MAKQMNQNLGVISASIRQTEMYDISNLVGYALGVHSTFLTHAVRKSAVLSFDTLKADEDLSVLRALCTVRNKVMVLGEKLEVYLGTHTGLLTFVTFPSYVRPTLEHAELSQIFSTDGTVYERLCNLNAVIAEHTRVLDRFLTMHEEQAAWVKNMFVFPTVTTPKQYLAYCVDFASKMKMYPSHCWYNTANPRFSILMSDHALMSTIAVDNGKRPLQDSEYRSSKVLSHCIIDGKLRQAQLDALSYLKGIMCEDDTRMVAIFDTQNLQPMETFCFLDWMYEEYTPTITKAILLVDGTEQCQWGKAEAVIPCPVERVTSGRIVRQKSTVDTNLLCRVMREFYEGLADTFLIFSGDCDFLPLVDNLPDARFCFFGLSGCVSGQSLRYASDHNAKFIIMDEHLRSIQYAGGNSLRLIDNIAARLNEKCLSAVDLITSVAEASSHLGQKIDNAVAQLLLNEMLSTYRIRVTSEGKLQFDYQAKRQMEGETFNGTHDAYWNKVKIAGF